jgi:uroporphyrinogen-III synthase
MILITRPVSQTKNLELLLNNRKIDYALFPAFEISKIHTSAPAEKYDIVIFISVNAVSYAEELFDKLFSDSSKVFAVGPATASQLLKKNIAVDCFPKENASSQELLKIKECTELSNRKILIVRGKGGSETLKNYLSLSNQVDYLEVYERISCKLSKIHKESLLSFVKRTDGISMATSNESLVNIIHLVSSASPAYLEILKSRRMIVFSERIKSKAEMLGFKKIQVTHNPSDEDFVDIFLNKKL